MDYNKKKLIVKMIDDIKDKKIYLKLYKIILNQNIQYTQNRNGIFINLNAIENDKLEIIYNFLCSFNINE
jgi:hypothetical protein